MIKRLLALNGVELVARFRDDGQLAEGYGLCGPEALRRLARFAHDYRRLTQANADQLAMFTGMHGWTPPGGWIIRGETMTVCCIGSIVCVLSPEVDDWDDVLIEMQEVSHW